jgi:cytochrome o ubiquinol oxidase subunit II
MVAPSTAGMRVSRAWRFAAPGAVRLAAVAALVFVAGCRSAVLDPKGPVGAADETILIDSLVIMLAIVIPTIVATLGFAWWYRASNERARYLPNWAYSGRIELIVWSIPLLVVILLGGVAWIGSHDLSPEKKLDSKNPPLEVQVVSLDWKWLFIYPAQHLASVNRLVIPVDVPVHFSLTSASVLNAFFVPQLGSMIYTMNRMVTQLNLSASMPGIYPGLASHYSGDGFSDMHFDVQAEPADRFAAWVAATKGTGAVLDEAAYAVLSRQSKNVPQATFHDVDPHLFDRIVAQTVPPAPGPGGGSPATPAARTEP